MTCPICAKHQTTENRIFETGNWIVSHGPAASQLLGYVYLEPKRHIENWSEFTDAEMAELGPLIQKVEIAIKKELPIDRLYAVTISEAVRHLHVHLIPRNEESEVKGLPLIEQATQQNAPGKQLSESALSGFIERLHERINGNNKE